MAQQKISRPLSLEEAEKERRRWGVPDWRIASAYNYTHPKIEAPLGYDQLRWEFLRRDPLYRAAWKGKRDEIEDFGLYELLNPKIRGDKFCNGRALFTDSIHRGGMLLVPRPPSDMESEEFLKYYGRQVLDLEENGYLILVFNPRRAFNSQLKRAQKIFENHRREVEKEPEERTYKHTNIPSEPDTLLRVLDAKNEGVSLLEIGREIYGRKECDATARAIAHERLEVARTCWRRM